MSLCGRMDVPVVSVVILFVFLAASARFTAATTAIQSDEAVAVAKPGGCPRRVLPADRCVANQTSECDTDSQCSGVAKCCSTGCAKFCVLPVYTACEQQLQYSIRRSRQLSAADTAATVRLPKCDKYGEFEPIQCGNGDADEPGGDKCWCVDKNGFELAGTRARSLELVNCSRKRECAAVTCRMLCPYSFRLDKFGCPLCQCWDPCQGVVCPGQLSCQLEEVPCANEPCPPVPTCKQSRSLDSLCSSGRPLTFSQTSRPFICGTDQGKPQCPSLHVCTVPEGAEYGVCCPSIQKVLAPPQQCPAVVDGAREQCGSSCRFNFQCGRDYTCCRSEVCGTHCSRLNNLTKCQQRRETALVMVVKEREGRGYVPQCRADGSYESRQCSRNGLICWCVGEDGHNVRGSMAPADTVLCSDYHPSRMSEGRSLSCPELRCGQLCPFGWQTDSGGCPSCGCAEPCDGYPCPAGSRCRAVNPTDCRGPICEARATCVPVVSNATLQYHITPPEPSTDPSAEVLVAADTHAVDLGVPFTEDDEDLAAESSQYVAFVDSTVINNDIGVEPDASVYEQADDLDAESSEEQDVLDDVVVDSRGNLVTLTEMESSEDAVPLEGGWQESSSQDASDSTAPQRLATSESVVKHIFSLLSSRRAKQHWSTPLVQEASQVSQLSKLLVSPPSTQRTAKHSLFPENGGDLSHAVSASHVSFNVTTQKPGQCPFSAPVAGGVSSSCSFQCDTDADCDGQAKCCSTGCGTACTQPLLATACQLQRMVLEDRARLLAVPLGRTYTPQCRRDDGQFEQIQCQPVLGVCWCVDSAGHELSSTRTVGRHNVRCQRRTSDTCPALTCATYCEHGRQLDGGGCATCECRRPCDQLRCPAGLQCRTVALRCSHGPCPPTAMCLPPAEQRCGNSLTSPLSGSRCGGGSSGCPATHRCHVSPFDSQHDRVCCPKPREVCQLPQHAGNCDGVQVRWHMSVELGRCARFNYTGCGGNDNNFLSLSQCQTVCPVLTSCEQLRERNAAIALRYERVTFMPRCSPVDGSFLPKQCQPEFGLCWCVTANGSRVPDTLTVGAPDCAARQARRILSQPARHNRLSPPPPPQQRQRERMCERGETMYACDRSLCRHKVCFSQPTARCRIDPCGGCRYGFFDQQNREVNCTRDLTPCQLERQQVVNSAAWRRIGEDEEMSAAHLYRQLISALIKSGDLSSETARPVVDPDADLLASGMPAVAVHCDAAGSYTPHQRVGSLSWCVDPTGNPRHDTVTRGALTCANNGTALVRQSVTPVCATGVAPRVCRHECARATCHGRTDVICVADPCNQCRTAFFSMTGERVSCDDRCSQPVSGGRCRGVLPRFFYDARRRVCRSFLYGGCGGNANNFHSLQHCIDACHKHEDVCSLAVSTGGCGGNITRWFYDPTVDQCRQFVYSGCQGNANNFATLAACQARCPDLVMCDERPELSSACSRGRVCGAAICDGDRDKLECRVEPCTCTAYFVDTRGARVTCHNNSTHVETISSEDEMKDAASNEIATTHQPATETTAINASSPISTDPTLTSSVMSEKKFSKHHPSSTMREDSATLANIVTPRSNISEARTKLVDNSGATTSSAQEMIDPSTIRDGGQEMDEQQETEQEVEHEVEVLFEDESHAGMTSSHGVMSWVTIDLPPSSSSQAVTAARSAATEPSENSIELGSSSTTTATARQARILAVHDSGGFDEYGWLASAPTRSDGPVSAAQQRRQLAVETRPSSEKLPFSALAVTVGCAVCSAVAAAAVVTALLRRRSSHARAAERARAATAGGRLAAVSGASVHEQLMSRAELMTSSHHGGDSYSSLHCK